MPRIAISGHRGLPEDTSRLIDGAIRALLAARASDVVGISCLADGADQLFARAVVDNGGALEVVVPADDYRDGLPAEVREEYDALLARAVRVHRLDFADSTSAAHMAAGHLMLDHADELWAVWDGLPVRVIWPAGARRD